MDENISSSTFTSEAAFAVKPANIIGDCAINSSGSGSPAQGAICNDGQMQSNKKKVAKGTARKIKNGGKEQFEWRAMDPTVPNFDFFLKTLV